MYSHTRASCVQIWKRNNLGTHYDKKPSLYRIPHWFLGQPPCEITIQFPKFPFTIIFQGCLHLENQDALLVNYSWPEIFKNCGWEKKLEQIHTTATEKTLIVEPLLQLRTLLKMPVLYVFTDELERICKQQEALSLSFETTRATLHGEVLFPLHPARPFTHILLQMLLTPLRPSALRKCVPFQLRIVRIRRECLP